MLISIQCNIENVEKYTGKNGFGANITVSQLGSDKRRESLKFNTNNAELASVLEQHLQEQMVLDLDLSQNNFGLRIGDVLSYSIVK